MSAGKPRIVIVGGGFAGLSAAKALKNAPVKVVLIDRTNHHLFQPLLYQVAISTLSPAQIAAPIREILASQRNTTVVMGEVVGAAVLATTLVIALQSWQSRAAAMEAGSPVTRLPKLRHHARPQTFPVRRHSRSGGSPH